MPEDVTIPPDGYRCTAHEAFTLTVENRLTTLETKVDASTASIDRMEKTQRNLVNEIQGQMKEIANHENSQNGRINELSGRIKVEDVVAKRDDKAWARRATLLKILIPAAVALFLGAGGGAILSSCVHVPDPPQPENMGDTDR